MTIRFTPRSVLLCVLLTFLLIVALSPASKAAESGTRPGPAAACYAWYEHVGALIDEHRIANDVDDDALFAAIRTFSSARAACSLGEFDTGLHLYESIALGRVKSQLR